MQVQMYTYTNTQTQLRLGHSRQFPTVDDAIQQNRRSPKCQNRKTKA